MKENQLIKLNGIRRAGNAFTEEIDEIAEDRTDRSSVAWPFR